MLLMSLVLQGSSGSGGDCAAPASTLSIMCREISLDACGADFPLRWFVASSSLDSSGEILKTTIKSTAQKMRQLLN